MEKPEKKKKVNHDGHGGKFFKAFINHFSFVPFGFKIFSHRVLCVLCV